jgi:hypothetical protein
VWIAFVIWFLVLIVVAAAVLFLARAESHRDAFSASIPDGEEYDARRALEEERKRGTGRIVAPGIVIAPTSKVEPGVTAIADSDDGDGLGDPIVATSSKVVEVQGILGPRKPVAAQPQQVQKTPETSHTQIHSDQPRSAAVSNLQGMPLPPREDSEARAMDDAEQRDEQLRLEAAAAQTAQKLREQQAARTSSTDLKAEQKPGSSSLANLVSKTEAKEAEED